MPKRILKDTFEQVKGYIFRLLKIRFRSEKEVRDKSRKKGFGEPTVDEAVGYFKAIDLINDRQFARKWIASRLSRTKPFGIHRIRFELKEKGIAPELINEEIAQVIPDYSETEIIAHLAQRQAVKHRNIPREKVKQRVYGYLLRRGFNPAAVMKAIKAI